MAPHLASDDPDYVPFTVVLSTQTLEAIDDVVSLREEQTGGEHTRQEFVCHAVLDKIDQLQKQRWAERESD